MKHLHQVGVIASTFIGASFAALSALQTHPSIHLQSAKSRADTHHKRYRL